MVELQTPPRIEALTVKNYRALRNVTLKGIQPLTVLLGANGSGKSTLFDVFAFLAECFQIGLRKAWDKRGRFRELRSRGSHDPIEIELVYREHTGAPRITYHLTIDERDNRPFVAAEWLRWRRRPTGRPFKFLDFENGQGLVISGEMPEDNDERTPEALESAEYLAVNTLGQLARNPRVAALRRFISGWYLSYLSADSARAITEAGAQERLSQTGDNLPNVIQYLKEQHPDRLEQILSKLTARVPRLERVEADIMPDGRLLLQIKDAPFQEPILARFASDGTLKLLAYLTILYDPQPPPLVGIEEPENYLHHRLLPLLAEECRQATERMQLMITTHSPFFIDELEPEEVWVLERDLQGYTQARQISQMQVVLHHFKAGAKLGDLWSAGYFGDSFREALR
ncbi:MAG: AAA family ATPase [Aggregatilineales bacterium]